MWRAAATHSRLFARNIALTRMRAAAISGIAIAKVSDSAWQRRWRKRGSIASIAVASLAACGVSIGMRLAEAAKCAAARIDIAQRYAG